MRKALYCIVPLIAVAGIVWLVWFKPGKGAEPEKQPETEVSVQVGKIMRATLRGYVIAYGVVEAEPAGERPAASARIAPFVPGVVAEVKCIEGQRVEKGAVLFQLDSRATDVAVDFAQRSVERQKKLVQVEGTSQKALQEAEQQLANARTQQPLLRIGAPLSGPVVRINVEPGEAVEAATSLAEVIDLDRLVVTANVPSSELGMLKAGQSVEVLEGKPTNQIAGTINYIGSQVDAKTGTAVVRAGVPANCGLRPGQQVTLRIVTEEHKDSLAVPLKSVVKNEEGSNVVAVVQGDKAVQKIIKAGLRDGKLVEVEGEGLKEGDVVVTVGAYGLPKETKVRVLTETERH